MDRKKLFKTLAYIVSFIFIINLLAGKLYWYSSIWWFDMPMHFLGGFWIGLMALWLASSKLELSLGSKSLIPVALKVLLFVLFIGIGWEIFEILVNEVITDNPFDYLDTSSDIFFDLAGGTVAIFYFFKIIMRLDKNTLQYKE